MRQAHVCFVREHIAAVEIRYAAIIDVEPSTAIILQRKRAHETFQRGAVAELHEGSKCKRTEATFSYTLVLVSVAVP